MAFGLIAFGRFVILPAVNWVLLEGLSQLGVLPMDRICRVLLFTMSVMPPAQNLVSNLQNIIFDFLCLSKNVSLCFLHLS